MYSYFIFDKSKTNKKELNSKPVSKAPSADVTGGR